MSKIIINNSFCQLVGFPEALLALIKTTLTYTNEEVIRQKQMLYRQIQRAKYTNNIKYLIVLKQKFKSLGPDTVCWLNENNEFPTGLLHIVKEKIGNANCQIDDKRKKPESSQIFRWNNRPPELRYYQKEAVDIFLQKGRGVIESAVGSGKTAMSVSIIKELSVNTLFVVTSSALLEQADDVLSSAFGKKNVQKITSKDIKNNKKLKPIKIVTFQTMHSLNKNGLLYSLLNDVEFVIIDEAHHSASQTFTSLLKSMEGIYYRLAMTGTYLRNDSKTLDLWGMCGEKIYEYSAAKATKEGFLTPVEFNIVTLPGKFNSNYQREYQENYGGQEMLKSIDNIIENKIPDDKQILILVDRKEKAGHLIYDYIKDKFADVTYVNGDDSKQNISEAIENFNNKKIRILIASQVLGEGVDIRSTDHLIMARGGKSEIAMTQAVGRAIRLYPGKDVAYVWDFNFSFCRYLNKHLNIRCDIYSKQFAGKINHL